MARAAAERFSSEDALPRDKTIASFWIAHAGVAASTSNETASNQTGNLLPLGKKGTASEKEDVVNMLGLIFQALASSKSFFRTSSQAAKLLQLRAPLKIRHSREGGNPVF